MLPDDHHVTRATLEPLVIWRATKCCFRGAQAVEWYDHVTWTEAWNFPADARCLYERGCGDT